MVREDVTCISSESQFRSFDTVSRTAFSFDPTPSFLAGQTTKMDINEPERVWTRWSSSTLDTPSLALEWMFRTTGYGAPGADEVVHPCIERPLAHPCIERPLWVL